MRCGKRSWALDGRPGKGRDRFAGIIEIGGGFTEVPTVEVTIRKLR